MSTDVRPQRGTRPSDDGFTLLEVIVAIAIVTVVMTALTSLFSGSIRTTSHFRAQQSAITLTTAALDHARSIGAVDAALGRDRASVDHQFAALADTPVGPWLTSMDPVYGDPSYEADLPTHPVTHTAGGSSFDITYVVGSCHRIFSYSAASADCTNSPRDGVSQYIDFTRVVVAASWNDASCSGGTCYHVSAVLLNGDEDPLFSMNYGDPPLPELTDCQDQEVSPGQDVRIMLFGKTQPHEDAPLCRLEGGVPPFSWTWTSLPAGLGIATDPATMITYVQGTVDEDATGPVRTIITVTDAYGHSDDGNEFTWTITDPLPAISPVGDQVSPINEGFSVQVRYSCPQGPCTFELSDPTSVDGPDKVSPVRIDADTGRLYGTAPEEVTVVHDLTVTITDSAGNSDTTPTFDWTFTDGRIASGITISADGSCLTVGTSDKDAADMSKVTDPLTMTAAAIKDCSKAARWNINPDSSLELAAFPGICLVYSLAGKSNTPQNLGFGPCGSSRLMLWTNTTGAGGPPATQENVIIASKHPSYYVRLNNGNHVQLKTNDLDTRWAIR